MDKVLSALGELANRGTTRRGDRVRTLGVACGRSKFSALGENRGTTRRGDRRGEAIGTIDSVGGFYLNSCVNVNGDKVLGRQAVARRRSLTVSE